MLNIKTFWNGLKLKPQNSVAVSAKGELRYNSSTDKVELYNGAVDSIVNEAKAAVLTNKSIDGNNNTLTNIPNSATTGDSANTPDTLVLRDSSGDFAAGNITASLTGTVTGSLIGNADSATLAAGLSATLIVAQGGTNSSTALNNNRIMQSSGGSIIEAAAISASKALASDSNGIPVAATTSTTELNYVAGVTSSIQTQIDAVIALTFPAGIILPYGGSAAPTGFLLCDGSSVLRATYPNLFTAIGTSFGSVDGSHFTLPNTARRVLMGAGGSGTATIGNTVGNSGGEEDHVLTTAELASHNHTQNQHNHTFNDVAHTHGITDPGHIHRENIGSLDDPTAPGDFVYGASGSTAGRGITTGVIPSSDGLGFVNTDSNTTGISINTANVGATISLSTPTNNAEGSDTAHNTIQPSLIINHIIKF